MKTLSVVITAFMLIPEILIGQTGSINNKLGSGGTFSVKNSTNDPLVTVDETTGQLTADRIKVDGVPSFLATHVSETNLSTPHTLASWYEFTPVGAHDNSASFNPSTGEFVVPRNGFYFLSAHIELNYASASGPSLQLMVDGTASGLIEYKPTDYTYAQAMLSVAGVLKLTAGQTVTLRITSLTTPTSLSAEGGYFSGYLVSDF